MGKLTHWAVTFAVIGLLAGVLGFGGGAGSAAPVAKFLFWFSLGMIVLSVSSSFIRRT
jgi:uncharacterized membrane protein YtjA (UPF0391 family)